ncbi:TetR/AcrR family transcriptional regulator [Undibacterium sp. CY18W]|uniref:TetR/AcrR family transcriptional regulator n=1 Tax=Undibacterium hunanense TaxID=2762292 RepID=A0ABR6ZKM4_9BURK|nr:TetR/AcrR family transcriptional regulator [Undibacterium hunanense]MBC3916423.1 TetR/AcrR family transcriptional regulator [Undibacterium hunanense]
MSRKSNTEQRRKEIVFALLSVMAEQGYEKATILAIAKKAELAPGLIHYHFKSKGEILIALVKVLAGLSRERYEALSASAHTPQEKLAAYVQARLAKGEGAMPEAVSAWVVIGAEAVRQSEVRAVFQEAIAAELALIQALLTACLEDQKKAIDGVAGLAAGLLAFMEGAFQLASAAGDVMPQGYAAATAMVFIENSLAVQALG